MGAEIPYATTGLSASSRALRSCAALVLVLALFAVRPISAAAESSSYGSASPIGVHDEKFVAGEALTIEVALDTASFLRGGYPIDAEGYVDLPILGKYLVAGRTRDEVETYLSGKFANYLRDTHIQVVPAIRLTLLGFFTHQGQYYVSPKSTVWEAVYVAGGIAGERTVNEITVQRGSTRINIPFLDEYSKGSTLTAAGFKSGDIVLVPIPRDNTGFWYWFTQGITVTAQLAAILTSAMSAYIIYHGINNR